MLAVVYIVYSGGRCINVLGQEINPQICFHRRHTSHAGWVMLHTGRGPGYCSKRQ